MEEVNIIESSEFLQKEIANVKLKNSSIIGCGYSSNNQYYFALTQIGYLGIWDLTIFKDIHYWNSLETEYTIISYYRNKPKANILLNLNISNPYQMEIENINNEDILIVIYKNNLLFYKASDLMKSITTPISTFSLPMDSIGQHFDISCFYLNHQNNSLYFGSYDGSAYNFDIPNHQIINKYESGKDSLLSMITINNILITGSDSGKVKYWDLKNSSNTRYLLKINSDKPVFDYVTCFTHDASNNWIGVGGVCKEKGVLVQTPLSSNYVFSETEFKSPVQTIAYDNADQMYLGYEGRTAFTLNKKGTILEKIRLNISSIYNINTHNNFISIMGTSPYILFSNDSLKNILWTLSFV